MLELFTNEFTILIFAAILSVISPVKGLIFFCSRIASFYKVSSFVGASTVVSF